MKRMYIAVVALFLLLNILVTPAAAALETQERIDYEDGSYAIVTMVSNGLSRAVIEKQKTYTYYNPLGQRCFAYTLYATFTYNGITSSADYCDFSIDIYRQGWDVSSHREFVSGNMASGSAAFTGPDNQTRVANLTLTCDKNGNVT